MNLTVTPYSMGGTISAPPSKSAAHRAVIAASLASGRSVIENVDMSSDISATIRGCESLGCRILTEPSGKYNTLKIRGGLKISGSATIDCAESGSTLRFLIPVSCTAEGKKIFTGAGRLPFRPIEEYISIFEKEGIFYHKPEGMNLPLTVEGKLSGGKYVLGGGVSSQYISGLMFAAPLLEKDTEIEIRGVFQSKGYADMTAETLRGFGIRIDSGSNGFFIRGNQNYEQRNMRVEGDYSQAAFFMAAAALSGEVIIDGLRADSLQPDRAVIDILIRMGARIRQTGDSLRVSKSELRGIDVDVSQCPDLVPPIAAAAALAKGTTRITGAARLRIKESDRLHALCENLNSLGISAGESEDSLNITGGQPSGGKADAFGDHRIAMALSVIAAGAPVTITGAECVNKSYPGYFEDFKSLGGKVL